MSLTEFVPGQMELLKVYPTFKEEPQRFRSSCFFSFYIHSYPIGEKYELGPMKLRTLSFLPERLPFLVGNTSLICFS